MCEGVKGGYLNNRCLPLNPNANTILAQVNVHILALERARDGRGHGYVADGLGPFVGELGLLGVFEGFAGFFVFCVVCHCVGCLYFMVEVDVVEGMLE